MRTGRACSQHFGRVSSTDAGEEGDPLRTIFTSVIGAGIALLGLLWLLQGADVVHVQPILCIADCEPVVGGSTTWLIAGLIAMLAGIALIIWGLKRRRSA